MEAHWVGYAMIKINALIVKEGLRAPADADIQQEIIIEIEKCLNSIVQSDTSTTCVSKLSQPHTSQCLESSKLSYRCWTGYYYKLYFAI